MNDENKLESQINNTFNYNYKSVKLLSFEEFKDWYNNPDKEIKQTIVNKFKIL